MSHLAVDLLERTVAPAAGRIARWTRVAAMAFAATVLLTLAFTVGRMTSSHSTPTTTTGPAAVVQPVSPFEHNVLSVCRPQVPC
jgi:TRAP-type C4-dicarboxylate transport system permease small subunit